MSKLYRRSHVYEELTPENRPQDPDMNGAGWTFKTVEHGGDEPDTMPQAIIATDAQGRSATYTVVTVSGRAVKSHHFSHEVVKDEP